LGEILKVFRTIHLTGLFYPPIAEHRASPEKTNWYAHEEPGGSRRFIGHPIKEVGSLRVGRGSWALGKWASCVGPGQVGSFMGLWGRGVGPWVIVSFYGA